MNNLLSFFGRNFIAAMLLFTATQMTHAQIVAEDAGGCIQAPPVDTWSPCGVVGGRNSYCGTLANGNLPAIVMWSTTNSRWEIRIDADWDGVSFSYESLAHHNSTFASTPNPPTLGSGTWVGDGGASGWPDYGCGDLGMSKKQLVTLSIE